MGLIDTHTHLDGFARRGELPDVLARARAAGLEAMIAVGTVPDDWALYQDLAREHPGLIHYTAGLHPCSVDAGWEGVVAQLEGYWGGAPCRSAESDAPNENTAGPAVPPYPVAVGEIGLDRFHLPKEAAEAARVFAWQRAAFAAGLELAQRRGVPVVVHSRGAFRECVEMIDASGVDWTKVVFHCFSEGADEMNTLLTRGGRGSFTGIITYKNADAVRAAARVQGLARLMIETDAPYLAPVPHRGKPNEPAWVRHTAEFCAALFGMTSDEVAAVTTKNAKAFFEL
ncbi:MAG: TatD family hydrolase [Opitutaceae bacterium]|nr:TatD family hydrolase [Opitutaceae bacterium]